jgi:hypothetical protein
MNKTLDKPSQVENRQPTQRKNSKDTSVQTWLNMDIMLLENMILC